MSNKLNLWTILAMMAGVVVGFALAAMIFSSQLVGARPADLGSTFQRDYLNALTYQYLITDDVQGIQAALGGWSLERVDELLSGLEREVVDGSQRVTNMRQALRLPGMQPSIVQLMLKRPLPLILLAGAGLMSVFAGLLGLFYSGERSRVLDAVRLAEKEVTQGAPVASAEKKTAQERVSEKKSPTGSAEPEQSAEPEDPFEAGLLKLPNLDLPPEQPRVVTPPRPQPRPVAPPLVALTPEPVPEPAVAPREVRTFAPEPVTQPSVQPSATPIIPKRTRPQPTPVERFTPATRPQRAEILPPEPPRRQRRTVEPSEPVRRQPRGVKQFTPEPRTVRETPPVVSEVRRVTGRRETPVEQPKPAPPILSPFEYEKLFATPAPPVDLSPFPEAETFPDEIVDEPIAEDDSADQSDIGKILSEVFEDESLLRQQALLHNLEPIDINELTALAARTETELRKA